MKLFIDTEVGPSSIFFLEALKTIGSVLSESEFSFMRVHLNILLPMSV